MTTTKERAFIARPHEIRGLREGRQTQVRRIVKPQPKHLNGGLEFSKRDGSFLAWFGDNSHGPDGKRYDMACIVCPYGVPGDRLIVRETFCIEDPREYFGSWAADPVPTDRPLKWIDDDWGNRPLIPHYRATDPDPHIVAYDQEVDDDRTRWTPSCRMPRWASRLTLEIVEVRVQRVGEISDEDARAEGIISTHLPFAGAFGCTMWHTDKWPTTVCGEDPARAYGAIWESIHGPGSWALNSWVWALTVRVVK